MHFSNVVNNRTRSTPSQMLHILVIKMDISKTHIPQETPKHERANQWPVCLQLPVKPWRSQVGQWRTQGRHFMAVSTSTLQRPSLPALLVMSLMALLDSCVRSREAGLRKSASVRVSHLGCCGVFSLSCLRILTKEAMGSWGGDWSRPQLQGNSLKTQWRTVRMTTSEQKLETNDFY